MSEEEFGRTIVTVQNNARPAEQPEFMFEGFTYVHNPRASEALKKKVRAVNESEAKHLWVALEAFDGNRRTAIDVGANVGTMTYAMALIYRKVYAYEPWPENFDHLAHNARLMHERAKIHLSPKAVGARSEVAPIYSSHQSRRDPHLFNGYKGAKGPSHEVKVVRLDDEIPIDEPIDLIKVDVEGTELDVLRGAARIIDQWEPLIYMETKRPAWAETEKFMDGLGYEVLASHTHNYLWSKK
jgi:FkbM family methyltransferase